MIVFTHPVDTLHGMFTMRRMNLDGKLELAQLYQSRVQLGIDSLFVSGRLPADTVALALQRLRAGVEERHFTLDADARASLRTGSFGRIRVPIHFDADARLPEREEGELEAIVNSLHVSVCNAQAFQGLRNNGLDLPAELSGHGALQIYLQAFSRADGDHDVTAF